MTDPIKIWNFDEAPKELQISQGWDEDFVILIPAGQNIPYKLQELGCCSNAVYKVNNEGEVFAIHEIIDTKQFFELPNYKGCTIIIIPCHA